MALNLVVVDFSFYSLLQVSTLSWVAHNIILYAVNVAKHAYIRIPPVGLPHV
jgi:hypothetical protein